MTKAALSSQLFTDPECWSGRGLNPRPPARQTGTLPTELTRRRLINQHWSNIQSKNYGYNSLMSQECTETLCSFHVKGTKWNRKQIKPFWSSTPFCHFLWASNRDQQVYNMRIIHDNKKLGFGKNLWVWKKKTLSFEKHLGFWKNLRFEKKNLSLKKTWVLKKICFFFFKKTWVLKKNLSLKKDMRFEKKPWVLKKSEFLKNLSFYKEKIIGLKIRPQT